MRTYLLMKCKVKLANSRHLFEIYRRSPLPPTPPAFGEPMNWGIAFAPVTANLILVSLALEGPAPHQIEYLDKLGWRKTKPRQKHGIRLNVYVMLRLTQAFRS